MASVYQKRGRWYAHIKDAQGAWRCLATMATSKGEARRLASDLERRAERQRLGLEPLPGNSSMTLRELCEWWLDERCPEASAEGERRRLELHVMATPLGAIPLAQVSTAALDRRLNEMKRAGAAPASVNKLRAILYTVFSRATRAQLWTGSNPLQNIETRRVPRRAYATLSAEEVPLLLPHVPDVWRGIFATALYTAMRKGELFGLLKRDVDLERGLIVVARSYERDTTKGGHADALPIAGPLIPFLAAAMKSPGELMFPWPDGRMRSREADPQKVLRSALARAGIVNGYEHTCRRCRARGTPHVERHEDGTRRQCPVCGMVLWPRATPRPLRFHDLRHSTATILLRAGVDYHRVQRILRHGDVRTTLGTYGHLDVEDLRDAVATLPDSGSSISDQASPEQLPTGSDRTPFATRLLPIHGEQKNEGPGARNFSATSGPWMEREKGFEPSTLALARRCSTTELFPRNLAQGRWL